MTKFSEAKVEEIYARFDNPGDWLDAEPFWKGMYWSETGGTKAELSRFGSRPDCRNLLVVNLPAKTRRSDIVAAIDLEPSAEPELKQLEKAFDEAGISFFDEKSIFDDSCDNTVSIAYAHDYLQECIRPAEPAELWQLIFVARRLAQATSVSLKGVVLLITDGSYYRGTNFLVRYEGERGYALSALQKEVVTKEGDPFAWIQNDRFRSLETPSPFDARFNRFADPAHADISADNGNTLRIAAIACDMGAHGVAAAILKAPEGHEYVLNLREKRTIRQTEKAIAAMVPASRQLGSIRALPGLRTRHRFIVVGGKIVADTPFSSSGGSQTISTGVYRFENGPAKVEATVWPDRGEKAIMRPFCETVVAALCESRPHWIVDIELSEKGPVLANISEILDGRWFGADEGLILEALQAYQASNFNESDLEPDRGASSSRSKRPFVEMQEVGKADAPKSSTEDAADFFDFLSNIL
jgi:hypothetical protein